MTYIGLKIMINMNKIREIEDRLYYRTIMLETCEDIRTYKEIAEKYQKDDLYIQGVLSNNLADQKNIIKVINILRKK